MAQPGVLLSAATGLGPVAVEAAPVQAMFTVMERVVLLTETLLRQQPWHLLLTVRVRLTVVSRRRATRASTMHAELILEVVLVVIPISAE